jgi:hypothetical protein
MKLLGFDQQTTIAATNLCGTDKTMGELTKMIIDRYKEKSKVTEEDVLKMILYLTREE